MVRHTISVPEPMSNYIESQLDSGQYGNISEYFRDLVRKDQERKQMAIDELREMIEKAEASGTTSLSMEEIRLEARQELNL